MPIRDIVMARSWSLIPSDLVGVAKVCEEMTSMDSLCFIVAPDLLLTETVGAVRWACEHVTQSNWGRVELPFTSELA